MPGNSLRGTAVRTKVLYSVGAFVSRRSILGSAAAIVATPAIAQECRIGPPAHQKGPAVFMDYDQLELDAAYDQAYFEPVQGQTYARLASIAMPCGLVSARHAELPTDQQKSKSSTFIARIG